MSDIDIKQKLADKVADARKQLDDLMASRDAAAARLADAEKTLADATAKRDGFAAKVRPAVDKIRADIEATQARFKDDRAEVERILNF